MGGYLVFGFVMAIGVAYIRGPNGGCYTYRNSGRKRYVDRSLCN